MSKALLASILGEDRWAGDHKGECVVYKERVGKRGKKGGTESAGPRCLAIVPHCHVTHYIFYHGGSAFIMRLEMCCKVCTRLGYIAATPNKIYIARPPLE